MHVLLTHHLPYSIFSRQSTNRPVKKIEWTNNNLDLNIDSSIVICGLLKTSLNLCRKKNNKKIIYVCEGYQYQLEGVRWDKLCCTQNIDICAMNIGFNSISSILKIVTIFNVNMILNFGLVPPSQIIFHFNDHLSKQTFFNVFINDL